MSGFLCDWTSYKNGNRISVIGNDVSWKAGGNALVPVTVNVWLLNRFAWIALVSTYGLKDSKYNSIVNSQVLLKDLFKE